MQIPRHFLSCAALAPLVALTACGPAEVAPEAAPQQSVSPSLSPSPKKSRLALLLDDVAESTSEAGGNYTVDVTATALGDAADIPFPTATHTFEIQGPDKAVRVTSYLPGSGEMLLDRLRDTGADVSGLDADRLSTTVALVPADGGEILASNHIGRYPVDAPWVRGVLTENNVPAEPEPTLDGIAPLFSELAAADAVALKGTRMYEGTEEVEDFEATKVAGEAAETDITDLGDDARATVEHLLAGPPEGMVDIALWVGEDDMPLRLEVSDNKEESTLVYYDFGSTSFDVPDEEQIGDLEMPS
ncbi:hypothetical protein FZ103_12270 [Streptomonospora sp. PA3]|uniref:hypothetical protein n=1 Tax=Streptomonospora sp. PA3 TaxID=2607326 RepID=UPI0012DDE5C3|nr:hypothetical protein [Streptomonospora sp. PA3]MUL41939.1 hypothetical protein [Streptomonospora sp. PA3]